MKKALHFLKHTFTSWEWLILFFLTSIWFLPMYFGKTVLFGDNFSLTGPTKVFAAQWITKGIVPFWNPFAFSGIQFIGDINQSLFYPSTVLFLIFSPSIALNLTLFIQVMLGLFGMYLVARSLQYDKTVSVLVAGVWGLSNQVGGALNNIATLQSLTLTPWVVFFGLKLGRGEKNSLVGLAVIVALQLIGGYPQHVLFALLVTGFLVILDQWDNLRKNWRKTGFLAGNFIVATGIAILLSSFVWLPFVEVLSGSTRTTQTEQQASAGSMYPLETAKFVAPFIFDNQHAGYRWGPLWNRQPTLVPFLSWVFLIFLVTTVLTKRWKGIDTIFASFAVFGLLYAMGQYFPLYQLTTLIPIIGSSRGPSTILGITLIVMSLWFGSLVQRNTLKQSEIRRWLIIMSLATVLFAIAWLFSFWFFAESWLWLDEVLGGKLSASPFHTIERDAILAGTNAYSLLFIAGSTVLALVFLSKSMKKSFVTLVLLQVLMISRVHFFFGPAGMYDSISDTDPISLAFEQMDLTNYRTLTKHYGKPYADFGYYQESLAMRAPFTDSFIDQYELDTFTRLTEIKNGATPNWNITQSIPTLHGYTTLVPSDYFSLVATTAAEVVKNPGINVLPYLKIPSDITRSWSVKYYIVDTKLPSIGEELTGLASIAEGGGYKIYELPGALSRYRYENNQPVELEEYEANPNEIQFRTINNSGQTMMIVADRFDPNWHVSVNGVEGKIENWQGMRRFSVPQGSVEIKMWFHPKWLYRGLLLSGFTAVILLLVHVTKKYFARKTSR